jgi:hypothetical protein
MLSQNIYVTNRLINVLEFSNRNIKKLVSDRKKA